MVTITNCFLHNEGKPNEHVELELTGPMEFFHIKGERNQVYATAGTVSFPSTLSLETARNLLGTQIRGSILRRPCVPRQIKLPDTDTLVFVKHEYEFHPEQDDIILPDIQGYMMDNIRIPKTDKRARDNY